jgi:hypothetical protein
MRKGPTELVGPGGLRGEGLGGIGFHRSRARSQRRSVDLVPALRPPPRQGRRPAALTVANQHFVISNFSRSCRGHVAYPALAIATATGDRGPS